MLGPVSELTEGISCGSFDANLVLPLLSQEKKLKCAEKTLNETKRFRNKIPDGNPELVHGLVHLTRLKCHGNPARYVAYCGAAAAFVGLHQDDTARFYRPDGHGRPPAASHSTPVLFAGLTSTNRRPGRVVGWGPGRRLALLDADLRHLADADDPPDVRVCLAAEHCGGAVVTAGAGNVCVWSAAHMVMRCTVRATGGPVLSRSVFAQMALAPPPRPGGTHTAFAACGAAVTTVDLNAGKVLEHKEDICSGEITALAYCRHRRYLAVASTDRSFKVWGHDWELLVTLVGHKGVVTSAMYCPKSGLLLSGSLDGTVRCWRPGEVRGEGEVQCVRAEDSAPVTAVGAGEREGGTFFSVSRWGVDFWSLRHLYAPLCGGGGVVGCASALTQILVSRALAPYPPRLLCVRANGELTLVSGDSGVALTRLRVAGGRLACAAYCLQQEALVALTAGEDCEDGVLLLADALSDPAVPVEGWDGGAGGGAGPACCLALYSHVADHQGALQEWRSLQEERGKPQRSPRSTVVADSNNRYLVILGQNGGCLSVLSLGDGKVLQVAAAHDGQRVTAVHAHPESARLVSAGEDQTVQVWQVHPYSKACLAQLQSVCCAQPPLSLALLGSQLALASRDPPHGTSLTQVHLLQQQGSKQPPPTRAHAHLLTGLCACPEFGVFATASRDGTVRIWSVENRLLRTFQLCAEPQCLAYGGPRGELFLGIRGVLWRMDWARHLPESCMITFLCNRECSDYIPDPLIIQNNPETTNDEMTASQHTTMDVGHIINACQHGPYGEDTQRQRELERLQAVDQDTRQILHGHVTCRERKRQSTEQTQKEAFNNYMEIIYGKTPNYKIWLEEGTHDLPPLLLPPVPRKARSTTPPSTPCDPEPAASREATGKQPGVRHSGALSLKDFLHLQAEDAAKKKREKDAVKKKKVVTFVVAEDEDEDDVLLQEDEEPSLVEVASPPPVHPTPSPVQRVTTPAAEIPAFLQQFVEQRWFQNMYPDRECIPSSLSPEDFVAQLLGYLSSCSDVPAKLKVLAALRDLWRQSLLENHLELFRGLIGSVHGHVGPDMTHAEELLIGEILKMATSLKSDTFHLVRTLLTLLAHKSQCLRQTALSLLEHVGVAEAERWLVPELDDRASELGSQGATWEALEESAVNWLKLWTSKYKEHVGSSLAAPLPFTPVDVLNYFCSTHREEHLKSRRVPAGGRNDAAVLSYSECISQPVHRLGETYSMARNRRPPGLPLPPLRSRPPLMALPSSITLPVPRVSLRPFPSRLREAGFEAYRPRYFLLDRSFVEYYR